MGSVGNGSLVGLCPGSFLPEAPPWPCVQSAPPAALSSQSWGATIVPTFLFQHVKTMSEIFNINFLFSLFPVTQDLVMAVHHSSAHMKQDTQ